MPFPVPSGCLPDAPDEVRGDECCLTYERLVVLERADLILHGIGTASGMMKQRRLSHEVQNELIREGAKGESFGAYYDLDGRCLMESTNVGVDLARVKPTCKMIAAAAGASKAEAIISILRHTKHYLLVTDQGAAERMLRILKNS